MLLLLISYLCFSEGHLWHQFRRPFRLALVWKGLALAWKGYEKIQSLHFSKWFYNRQGIRSIQQEIVHKLVHGNLSNSNFHINQRVKEYRSSSQMMELLQLVQWLKLTDGNLPNFRKNLRKTSENSAGLCSFFKSILGYKYMFL